MYIYRSFYYRRRTRVNRQMDVFVCFASLEQARARSPTVSTALTAVVVSVFAVA